MTARTTLAVSAVAIAMALGFVAGSQPQDREIILKTRRPRCYQRAETHSGNRAPNVIIGTVGNDSMRGRGGDDSLFGLSGRDRLCGGPGDDQLVGGDGFDRLNGGDGFDQCAGEIERKCEG